MKKFFTILLSVLMTFSICLAIGAENGLDFVATPNESDTVKKVDSVTDSTVTTSMYIDTTDVDESKVDTEALKAINNGNVKSKVTAEEPKKVDDATVLSFDVKPVYTSDESKKVNTNGITVTFSLNVGATFPVGTRVYVEHFCSDGTVEYSTHDVTSGGLIWVTTTKGFSKFIVGIPEVVEEAKPTPTVAPSATPETKVEENNNNNDASAVSETKVVTCADAMGSKDWVWSEAKKACVYKVTNTSAK